MFAGVTAFPAGCRARLTLDEQKRAFLVEQHIATADALVEQLQLEDAEAELARALELDADNLEAKTKLAEVGALLGREPGRVHAVTEDLAQRHELKVQQLRVEADDALRSAKMMISQGDYDGAIGELTIALNHIKWAPYSIEGGGMDEEVADLLERAKAARSEAARELLADAHGHPDW